jgi:hypothetical protein
LLSNPENIQRLTMDPAWKQLKSENIVLRGRSASETVAYLNSPAANLNVQVKVISCVL